MNIIAQAGSRRKKKACSENNKQGTFRSPACRN